MNRIAIDARWIFAETSGIGRYTRELIRHLLRLDADMQWILLHDDAARAESLGREWKVSERPGAHLELLPWSLFSPRNQWSLPRALRALQAEVYHAPNWLIPYAAFPRKRARALACVVTLHDLIPLRFPHFTPRARKTRWLFLFRLLVHATVRRADAIIAPSEATRRDLLDYFRLRNEAAERVVVIPEAADERFRPAAHPPSSAAPTVLYVGRRDPYKNLPRLLEAFAHVRAAMPEARLQIIGPPDPRYPEAEETARRLGLGISVLWCGHLEFNDVVEAYQHAAVFVLPSRCEGFGLPILEAMACGTPVVCSEAPALVEVAGGAALHAPADDATALANAILCVLRNPAVAAELRARGLARAARFSWTATAQKTLQVYEKALRRRAEARVHGKPL